MTKKTQSGFATLTITLVLLMLGTLAVLSSSRVVFFEQKTSNNAYHYRQAASAAKAGLANGLTYLGNNKATLPNKASLIDNTTRKLKPAAFPLVAQLTDSKSGYSLTMTQPNASDLTLILVTSKGCADGCAPCTTDCGVQVTVSEYVKLKKLVVNLPDDALLSRGSVQVGGAADVENVSKVGVTIRAGGNVDASKVSGAKISNDPILAASLPDVFFNYFFNDTKAAVKNAIPNLNATFPPLGEGGAFWIDGDTAIHGGTYGSPSNPVVLIVNGNLAVNAGTTVYGLIYVIGGFNGWANSGGGTANLIGAAISEASFSTTGNLTISKDSAILGAISATTSPGKVLASWKDF